MGKHTNRMVLLTIIAIVISYFAKERIQSFFEETILLNESSNSPEYQKPEDQLFDKIKKISDLWRKLNKLDLFKILITSDEYLSKKTREEKHTTQTDRNIVKITETSIIVTEKNIRKTSKDVINDENNKHQTKKREGGSAYWSNYFSPKIEDDLSHPPLKTSTQKKYNINTSSDKVISDSTITSQQPFSVAAEDDITRKTNYNYNSELSDEKFHQYYGSSSQPYGTDFFETSDTFSTPDQRQETAREGIIVVKNKDLKNITYPYQNSENIKPKTRTETIVRFQNTLVSSISPEVFSEEDPENYKSPRPFYETYSADRSDVGTTPSMGKMEDLIIITHSSLNNQATDKENSEKLTASNLLITQNRATADTNSPLGLENKTITIVKKSLMLTTEDNYSSANRESKNSKSINNLLIDNYEKTTNTEGEISLLPSTQKNQSGQSQILGEAGKDQTRIIPSSINYIKSNITSPGDITVRSKNKSVSSFFTEEKLSSTTFEALFTDYSNIEHKRQTTNADYKVSLMSSTKESESAAEIENNTGKKDSSNSLTNKDRITSIGPSKKDYNLEVYTRTNSGFVCENGTIVTYPIIGEDSETTYTTDMTSITSTISESTAKSETKNDKMVITKSLIIKESKTSSTLDKVTIRTTKNDIIPKYVTQTTDSSTQYNNNSVEDTGYTTTKYEISLFSGSPEISGNTDVKMDKSSSPIYEIYLFDGVNTEQINETINSGDNTSLTPSTKSSDPGENTEMNIDKTVVTKIFVRGGSKTTNTEYKTTTKVLRKDNIPENEVNTTVSLIKYKNSPTTKTEDFSISHEEISSFTVSPKLSGSTDLENDETLSQSYETYFFNRSNTDQNSQATNREEKITSILSTNYLDTEASTETENDKTVVTNTILSKEKQLSSMSPTVSYNNSHNETETETTRIANSFISKDKKSSFMSMINYADTIPEETSVKAETFDYTDLKNDKSMSPASETYFFELSDAGESGQATSMSGEISAMSSSKNINSVTNTETENDKTVVTQTILSEGSKLSSILPTVNYLDTQTETENEITLVTRAFISVRSKTTNREDKKSLMRFMLDITSEDTSIRSEISGNTDLENLCRFLEFISPKYETYFFDCSYQWSQTTKIEDTSIAYVNASYLATYGEPNNGKTIVNTIVGEDENMVSMLYAQDNSLEAHTEVKYGGTIVTNSLAGEDGRTSSTSCTPEGSSLRLGKPLFPASIKIYGNSEQEDDITLSPLNETFSFEFSNAGQNGQATNTRDTNYFMKAIKDINPVGASFFSNSTDTTGNTHLENDESSSSLYESNFSDCVNTEQNDQTKNTADKISLGIDSGAKNDNMEVTNTFSSKDSKSTNAIFEGFIKTLAKDNIPESDKQTVSLIKYTNHDIVSPQDPGIISEETSLFSVSTELFGRADQENNTTSSPLFEAIFFDGLDSQTTLRNKTSIISSTKRNEPEANDETKNDKTVITSTLESKDSETSLILFTKGDVLEAVNTTKNRATIIINTLNSIEIKTTEMPLTIKYYLEVRPETKNDTTVLTNSFITEGCETKNTSDAISIVSPSNESEAEALSEPIKNKKLNTNSLENEDKTANKDENITLTSTKEIIPDQDEDNQTTKVDNIILMFTTAGNERRNDRTVVANSLIGQDSKTTNTKDTINLMSSANESGPVAMAELMNGKKLVTNSLANQESETANKENERTLMTSTKDNHLNGLTETKARKTTVTSSLISNDSKTTVNLSDGMSSTSFSEGSDSIIDAINQTGKTTSSVNTIHSYKASGKNNISISLYDLLVSYNATHLWGEVSLTFLVSCASDQIILDYGGISVSFSSLCEAREQCPKSPENNRVGIKNLVYDKPMRKVIIELMSKIKSEYNYILNLKFISELSKFERGATLTTYSTRSQAKQNQRRWIIGTFLFPNFGKMVFPCIETPERRAVFHLRLNRNKSDQAVSNAMKVKTQMITNDIVMDDFYQTPAIPISSFSFNILPKYDSLIIERTPTLAFWFPPHLRYPVELVVTITNQILDFFIEYFHYNLPIQQITVVVSEDLYCDPPASFATILISSKYLFEKYEMNYEHKENLYHFLAKQFCDLWIGNIVSFNSWNDYWIKEGFSIYMAHLATMDIYDDYDFSSFNMRIQQNAFRYHRLPFFDELYKDELYTNSIRGNNSPTKGAFLLHMVYNILKPQPFQEAIRIFFKDWALQSVSPEAFWNSFNIIQENFDVKEFINSWAFNYYPTLNVDYENDTIIVKKVQQSGSNSHYNLWWIPISYFNGNDIHFDHTITHWLKQEQSIRIKFHFNDTWIIFNPQYSGFVRFNYSRQLWKMIIGGLRKGITKLPSSVKAQLLDDSFTLASEGFLDYSIPMTMALYLKNEEEYAPWFVALKHFSFLAEVIVNYPEWQIFQRYMAGIMSQISLKLQIKTNPVVEKEIQGQLRKILMSWSCMNELSNGCDKWALDKFLKWKDDPAYLSKCSIPTELRSIIYCMGAKFYDDNSSKYLYSFSKAQNISSGEALRLLEGVTCTSNSTKFMEIMNDMFDNSNPAFSFLRLKEFALSLKQSRINSLLSFQYIKDNWQTIYKRFHESNGILNAIIEGSTYFLRTKQYYNEVLALRKSVPKTDYTTLTSLDLAIDQIEFNMNWDIRNLYKFRKWLNFYNKTLT